MSPRPRYQQTIETTEANTRKHIYLTDLKSIGCRYGWIQVHRQFIRKIQLSASWFCFQCRFVSFSHGFSFSVGGRGERWAAEAGRGQSKKPFVRLAKRLGFYPQARGDLVKNLKWEVRWAGLYVSFPQRSSPMCCVVSMHVRNWILPLEGWLLLDT